VWAKIRLQALNQGADRFWWDHKVQTGLGKIIFNERVE
jgi:hypothetical protein